MSLSLHPIFSQSRAEPLEGPRFWSDGTAIGALPEGWFVRRSRHLLRGLHLFDIEDAAGVLRTWFAREDGTLVGCRPDRLPEDVMLTLRNHIHARGPLDLHGPDGALQLDRGYMSAIVLDPALLSGSGLLFRNAAGTVRPVLHWDRTPVDGLHSGWSVRLMFTGLAPLLVLDLEHIHGARAVWFIDENGLFLGDSLPRLSDEQRRGITAFIQARAAWHPGTMHPDLAGYCLLNSVILAQTELLLSQHEPGGDVSSRLARPAQRCGRLAGSDPGRLFATLPYAVPLAAVEHPDLKKGGYIDRRLSRSWFNLNGKCLGSAEGVQLPFELPYRPTVLRLALELKAIGRARRATVSLNGWDLATFLMRPDPDAATSERRDIWVPAECIVDTALQFDISFDPADPATACSLEDALLETGPPVRPVVIPPAADLLNHFGSLGFDCEFGFVQRFFGIEPLGLFRFAGYSYRRNLLRLIESDFEGLGSPGSLITGILRGRLFRADGEGYDFEEFYMTDPVNRYGFHTWKGPADSTEPEALAANEQKLRYLVRKMIEDLEDGEKIWVYKDPKPVADFNEMFSIFHAINRKGPNKLFWVTRAVEGRPVGAVEWIGTNLLRGYSDQPHDDARVFDAEQWLMLCSNAYRAFSEQAPG